MPTEPIRAPAAVNVPGFTHGRIWVTPEDLYAGCLFPVGKHVQFNTYHKHENNTGKSPNQSKNDIGLALNLYYSLAKK
jgi:hypothetical protein